MKNNIIELTPYLPAPNPEVRALAVPERKISRESLPYLSAFVESLVTVGIGFCFVMGVVISLVIAL